MSNNIFANKDFIQPTELFQVKEVEHLNEFTPFKPSIDAIRRVGNPLEIPTDCHVCNSTDCVEVQHHKIVYGRIFKDSYPWCYVCTNCGARVGLHPNTNIPLGTLADSRLRSLRCRVKDKFIRITSDKDSLFFCLRPEAYKWLSNLMGIDIAQCHFGWFNEKDCIKAEQILDSYLEDDVNHEEKYDKSSM